MSRVTELSDEQKDLRHKHTRTDGRLVWIHADDVSFRLAVECSTPAEADEVCDILARMLYAIVEDR